MNVYSPAETASAAYFYPTFHDGPDCVVTLVTGPTEIWVSCGTCRVAVRLESVSGKIAIGGCSVPRSEVPVDPSNTGVSG